MKKRISAIGLLVLPAMMLQAQIYLDNPSFEDSPRDATMPTGWESCGEYTTPDILPGENKWGKPIWDVIHKPTDGETYLGLITRVDNTSEHIGQKLSTPIKANQCYRFTLDLARSPYYAGYNKPIVLEIWLGNALGKQEELLDKIEVGHYEWQTYEIVAMIERDMKYISFKAHYVAVTKRAYRGNVLMDNISVIESCE